MKNKKLNIAIFHLAFVYSGGGERLVLEEAIRLKRLGHKVTCFVPTMDEKNCFPELIKQVKIKRILPKILPKWYPDNALLSVLAACIFVPFFYYKFKNYDIYFGANQPGPWIAYILSKLNRRPYIIYLAQPTRLIHPRLIDQQVGLRFLFGFSILNVLSIVFKPIISFIDFKSIKNANKILANGTYAKGLLEEVYNIKAINCPAGSENKRKINKKLIKKRFQGNININNIKVSKPYVLLTNRHFPHKKFEYAIDAFKKLKHKDLNLIISGKETEYTESLKIIYKNNKKIKFLGLLNESDLENTYKNAAVYVYPAPEEDFGMGIIEAMSYAVPVVAWGNAGPTGIIENNKDGLLAKPFNLVDFAVKIDDLLFNRNLYINISQESQIKVKRNFSYNLHIRKLNQELIKCYYEYNKFKHKNYNVFKKLISNLNKKKYYINNISKIQDYFYGKNNN